MYKTEPAKSMYASRIHMSKYCSLLFIVLVGCQTSLSHDDATYDCIRATEAALDTVTCSPTEPCQDGQGDCDSDADCVAGARCVDNVGLEYGYDSSNVDVCVAGCPDIGVGDSDFCTSDCPCEYGEGDCDTDSECVAGLFCLKDAGLAYGYDDASLDVCISGCPVDEAAGGGNFCSSDCPCDEGQGDCDSDAECAAGLRCLHDAGAAYGFDPDTDVCVSGCPDAGLGGSNFCIPDCPCDAGEGDCDRDADCGPGLDCVHDVGADFGWGPDVDVCLPPNWPPTDGWFVYAHDDGSYLNEDSLVKLTDGGARVWSITLGHGFTPVGRADTSVWVTDRSTSEILRVDPDGTIGARVSGFGSGWMAANPNDSSIWASTGYDVVHMDEHGVELSRTTGFQAAWDVTVDPRDNSVWVGTRDWRVNNPLVKLDAQGHELLRVNTGGLYSNGSQQLAVDPRNGDLWQLGAWTGFVYRRDQNGQIQTQIAGFVTPVAVAVDPEDGSVWVCQFGDTSNPAAVIKLDPSGTELARVHVGPLPAALAVNPDDGSVWVGFNGGLSKLDSIGNILTTVSGFQQVSGVVLVRQTP